MSEFENKQHEPSENNLNQEQQSENIEVKFEQNASSQAQYINVNTETKDSGKSKATASLVLGIVAIVTSWIPLIGLACGIVGLIMAAKAKREGFTEGLRTAGFIVSIIGTVFGALYGFYWLFIVLLFAATMPFMLF